MREIKELIIHCSASDVASYDFARIKDDHTRNRGWRDIGYHFGIDFDGDIHILRSIEIIGAHCRGRNTHSIGICVLGLQAFNGIQMQQLGKLCDTLCHLLDLKADDVKPHNYYNKNKTCPVFDVEYFKDVYMRVA